MKQRYVFGIALLAGCGLGLLLNRLGYQYEPASKAWYRLFADSGLNPDLAMGGLFGLFALGHLVQTVVTLRKGFVYCGPFERVYRDDSPRRYRFWRGVQFLLTGALVLLAVISASGALRPG